MPAAQSLFLVALGHLTIELCSQFLPILYPILVSTLGLNYTQVGTIAMVAGVGTSLAQPLFGYLSDRWNPRWISALSVAWIGLIMGMVGLTRNYVLILLIVGLGVLGSAAFHPSAASIAGSSSGARRGAAVSVFSLGGTVGSVLSPLWVMVGIRWLGVRGTLLLVPAALLASVLLARQLGSMPPGQHSAPVARKNSTGKGVLAGMALIVLAVMCVSWFQGTLKTYLPIWIESQGQSVDVGGQVLFALLASLGVGSLLGGSLSDRLGRWQLYALSLGLLVPVTWFFLNTSGLLQWALIALSGILVGATFPIAIILAQETWPGKVGIASGLVMGLGWVPAGVGAAVTGKVADQISLSAGLRTLIIPAVLGALSILAYAVVQRSMRRAAEVQGASVLG